MKIHRIYLLVVLQFALVLGISAGEVENVVILGSGAAGSSAAIFTAQANLQPLVIQDVDCNAQMAMIHSIDNYPGVLEEIDGVVLLNKFRVQAENFGARFVDGSVSYVDFTDRPYKIELASGEVILAESVIIATGTKKKWLNLPGEDVLRQAGVTGASFCKQNDYHDKTVVVTGGGHAALQEAHHISPMASKVILANRGNKFNASKLHQEMVFEDPKIEVLYNTEVVELLGLSKGMLTGVVMNNKDTDDVTRQCADILIVAIGNTPNSYMFEGQLEMTPEGNIVTNNSKTNIPGVFAAGDVTDKAYGRVAIASGSGAMAALEAIKFLNK
jgi:thioredoxin reductase (NADPH)